jgi:hypothetical protein
LFVALFKTINHQNTMKKLFSLVALFVGMHFALHAQNIKPEMQPII